jgi:hypothetical protein
MPESNSRPCECGCGEEVVGNKDKRFATKAHARRTWYQENRARQLEYSRRYAEENRERVIERKRKYYQENRERCCEYSREWDRKNPEKVYLRIVRQNMKQKRKRLMEGMDVS